MYPSGRMVDGYARNSIYPPYSSMSNGEFLEECSSKIKLPSNAQQSNMNATHMEFGFSMRSSMPLVRSGFHGNNLETPVPATQSEGHLSYRHHYSGDALYDKNKYAASMQSTRRISTETRAANTDYSSFTGQVQSVHCKKPLTSLNALNEQTVTVSNFQPSAQGSFSQPELYKSSSHRERGDSIPYLGDFPCYGQTRPSQSNYMRLDFQQNSVEPQMSVVSLGGKLNPQENSKAESSCISGTDSMQISGCFKKYENEILVQKVLQQRCSSSGNGLAGDDSGINQGHANSDAKITMTKLQSGCQNSKHSLNEETKGTNGGSDPNLFQHDPYNEASLGSIPVAESYKSENVAPTLSEKLWNGTVQLNSNVKMSAVAYFKSGEKTPHLNWSESVEVKGKVRFDAFEKYIQDLPRSRNRGLMVMSLCWKEGSAEPGLKSIKEVARKYKEGKRIGFAQPVPGIDLYICPHSDTIITILAKYGFFKGLVAVEDNQDSWIACVVWRKNLPPNSSMKRLKEKDDSDLGQPLSSTTDCSTLHVTGKNSPSSATVQEGQTKTECVGNNVRDSKNPECSAVQPDLGSSSSSASPGPSASLSANSSSIPVEQQTIPQADLALLQKTIMQLSEIETSLLQSLGLEKLKANLELLKPMLPLPSDAIKQPAPASEDDDLPEYDFRTGVPQSQLSKPLEAGAIDKSLKAEGFEDSNGCVLWKNSTINEMLPSGQIGLEDSSPHRPQEAVHGPPPRKSVQELELQSDATMGTKRKHLFDDDDMPEWCPPVFELPKQPVRKSTGSSFSANPAEAVQPTFVNSSLPPLLPTPPVQLQFPAEPISHGSHHPATLIDRASPSHPADVYMHGGPSTTEYTSKAVSRHQLDPRVPIHPTRWKGRKQ
ncbi:hypothetical protein Ancab_035155 [Ancistrocladus abbreviatus]